jgi:hypothetical protein
MAWLRRGRIVGLVRSPGKWVQGQLCRGFESLPLRQHRLLKQLVYGLFFVAKKRLLLQGTCATIAAMKNDRYATKQELKGDMRDLKIAVNRIDQKLDVTAQRVDTHETRITRLEVRAA